jgi:hypothetical protein
LFGKLHPKLHDGLLAAPAKASALGQVPAGLAPGTDFSFESIADVAVMGFGDLICSSQALSRARHH